MDDALIKLDPANKTPIYQQIYRRFRQSIAQGLLKPGDRVPSLRSLAGELGIARGTAEAAYDLLIGEGYLISKGPGGTVVAPIAASAMGAAAGPPRQAVRHAPSSVPAQHDRSPLIFQMGLPALDAFPLKLWTRLAARHLRGVRHNGLVYPDPFGHAPLREAIAGYLQRSRGIACTPGQVFITAGYRAALDLACRTLLQAGDRAWVENPGYPLAKLVLEQAGAKLVPVPVDEEGLRVDEGMRRAAGARFAVVTPSHQSPLGVSLSLSRRLELLNWAAQAQAWIVEDDYDGEYRYRGNPLPALKSLDQAERVLYAGTFSKVLFPGLRLAYLVVPETQVSHFERTMERSPYGGCPEPMQAVVAEFIQQGHFARHVKKMRILYGQRRTFLAQALLEAAGDLLTIELEAGGMHLLARLAPGLDDKLLSGLAKARSFGAQPLSSWDLEEDAACGLLMSFTNIESPAMARKQARALRQSWQAVV